MFALNLQHPSKEAFLKEMLFVLYMGMPSPLFTVDLWYRECLGSGEAFCKFYLVPESN